MDAFRSTAFLKRDSATDVFLWNLQNFLKHLFLQNTSNGCFRNCWLFEIQSSNIQNDIIIKCWMKQEVNQSNIKIVLNETENVAGNPKQTTNPVLLHGNIHFSETPHIYKCMLNFCTLLSCNSLLKSHRSSHHRCSTKKLFLKFFQYSQANTCFFNKVAGLHNFLETYYRIKKKTCKWFFLKPHARKHANYACFHKLIFATSNMAERTKQYVHFHQWVGLSAHTRRTNYVHWWKETAFYFIWFSKIF